MCFFNFFFCSCPSNTNHKITQLALKKQNGCERSGSHAHALTLCLQREEGNESKNRDEMRIAPMLLIDMELWL